MTKTANVTSVSASGQTVTYTFAVTNTGNVTLNDVDVTDAQAAPSLDSSLGRSPADDRHQRVTTVISSPRAPRTTCSATYTVTQADLNNGSVRTRPP